MTHDPDVRSGSISALQRYSLNVRITRDSGHSADMPAQVGRVEDGRGSLGHSATPRFPSPLIKPDVPISGIRLSDWLHREAYDGPLRRRLRFAVELSLKAPDLIRRCQAHHQSPSPHHLQKRTRSRGPLLRRHYPASALLLPRPTPALSTA